MEAAKTEVEQLHRFFQDWFNGDLPNTDAAFARFDTVMGEAFEMVVPAGATVPRPALMKGLRGAYGKNKHAPCRIWIEAVSVRQLADGLVLVAYQEWQEMDGQVKGRQSTAIMRQVGDKPNNLVWQHLHETWLPSRH